MKIKSSMKFSALLTLILFYFSFMNVYAQSEITAIDILLDPDQVMLDSAKVFNTSMLQNYPEGFALDANHAPHITVVQSFVRTSELDKVYAAVENVVENEKPATEILTATGMYYIPYNNLGLAGITVKTTPGLLSFQAKLLEAILPYTGKGTGEAFVPNLDSSEISKPTIDYVTAFESEHSGDKFNPHVTIGLAQEDFIKEMMTKKFNRFTFTSESVSIYQLGDLGTAQNKLWSTGKR